METFRRRVESRAEGAKAAKFSHFFRDLRGLRTTKTVRKIQRAGVACGPADACQAFGVKAIAAKSKSAAGWHPSRRKTKTTTGETKPTDHFAQETAFEARPNRGAESVLLWAFRGA